MIHFTISQSSRIKTRMCTRILFTADEDQALIYQVGQFGENWEKVAQYMSSRSPRQCRDRYKNYLHPMVKNGPWSKDEDAELLYRFRQLGPKWSKIAKYFPGRTDVNIKNRYTTIGPKNKKYLKEKKNNIRRSKEITQNNLFNFICLHENNVEGGQNSTFIESNYKLNSNHDESNDNKENNNIINDTQYNYSPEESNQSSVNRNQFNTMSNLNGDVDFGDICDMFEDWISNSGWDLMNDIPIQSEKGKQENRTFW
ncbi:Myb-like DNA-binding domain containing protein [Tritrichomonas foetus]|uniref:Myb-like DNA-binding domain containing protein n=1 Tax=Tritrichomonas foetus TaxID=1144522 RepID=A0A1J4K6I8_9EUKA|nr:Myb-like DNA-binding domain containing protein [Tritrichomonas foetus]|eukprot:OHT07007.1 Myb-like DNA-binding domain containing protein [Tritrichomonas foetus]